MAKKRGTCESCGREQRIEARGLCSTCWRRDVNGTVVDFEQTEHEYIASELLWIGFDPTRTLEPQFEIYAHRFDMTAQALAKAWYRAQGVAA